MSSAAVLRLQSDLRSICTDPPEGCSASPTSDTNIYIWRASIFGPQDTPWVRIVPWCLLSCTAARSLPVSLSLYLLRGTLRCGPTPRSSFPCPQPSLIRLPPTCVTCYDIEHCLSQEGGIFALRLTFSGVHHPLYERARVHALS